MGDQRHIRLAEVGCRARRGSGQRAPPSSGRSRGVISAISSRPSSIERDGSSAMTRPPDGSRARAIGSAEASPAGADIEPSRPIGPARATHPGPGRRSGSGRRNSELTGARRSPRHPGSRGVARPPARGWRARARPREASIARPRSAGVSMSGLAASTATSLTISGCASSTGPVRDRRSPPRPGRTRPVDQDQVPAPILQVDRHDDRPAALLDRGLDERADDRGGDERLVAEGDQDRPGVGPDRTRTRPAANSTSRVQGRD